MIQITALPSSMLPVNADVSTETGMESPISADFAAMLAQKGAALPEAGPDALAMLTAKQAAATGNETGKLLPLDPPGVEAGKALSLKGLTGPGEMDEKADVPADPAPALVTPFLSATLPVAALPITNLPANVTDTEVGRPPQTGHLSPLPLPLSATGSRQALAMALQPIPAQPLAPQPDVAVLAQMPAASATALSIPVIAATTPPSGALTVSLTLPEASPATRPAEAVLTIPAPALPPVLAQAEPVIAPPATLAPVSAELGMRQTKPLLSALDRGSSLANAKASSTRRAEPASETSAVSVSEPLASGEEATLAPPRPVVVPQAAIAPAQDRPPQAATASAAPNARTEAPADFSTLVDRLVAARDAAQASLGVQAVHAALAHAEFGKVSLRFEQQDGALKVALSSADPDFARSVLASAPATQQGSSDNERNSSAGRQDGTQPQMQGQSQSQTPDQSPQRSQAAQTQPALPNHKPSDPGSAKAAAEPQRRNGIFA